MRYIGAALAAAIPCVLGQTVSVIQSSATTSWQPLPSLTWGADFPAANDVSVNRSQTFQTMMGFGAAFTDTSAYNVEVWMNPQVKEEFFEAYWGTSGLGYTMGRVTINSADYSFQSFNYDNVTDDFLLVSFDHTLAYDQQRVIPMIRHAAAKLANATGESLKLFGSPWSPPGWFKTNGNMINSNVQCLKNDTDAGSYRATWAAYILEWLRGYEAAGLPMWGLTPQNEPLARQEAFESCYYSPQDMAAFIGDYLGPTVKSVYPDLQIMLYDHNKVALADYAAVSLSNATVAQYIDGIAAHWYDYYTSLGLQSLVTVNQQAPSLFMLNTEACYLESLQYDWSICELYAVDILGGIAPPGGKSGLAGWMAWNHVLLMGDKFPWWLGGPNHDNTTEFGDPILFNYSSDGTQSLVYQCSYYVIGHVSRYARPGSTRVGVTGAGLAATFADMDAIRAHALGQSSNASLPLVATAFVSPDGSTASAVVFNPSDSAVTFKLRDFAAAGSATRAVSSAIPAHSIQTYTWAL